MKSPPVDQLAVLHSALRGVLHDEVTSALTLRQLQVLLTAKVGPRSRCTVRGMAEDMDVPKPSISRAIDRVAGLHLIERERDPTDGRNIFVALTEKGERFVRDIEGAMAAERAAA